MTQSNTDAPSGGLARLWHQFPLKTHHGWMNLLLLAIPAAIGAHLAHASPLVIFLLAAVAIVPLAAVLGEATEVLSAYSGPLIGGILNGTMGNATELIIAFFALRAGHIEVVKASLSGSIIGNLLLVLGLAILLGGRGREKQTFSRTAAGSNSSMLFLAVAGLVMPAVYDLSVAGTLKHEDITVQTLSLWTSAVLILIYVLSFVFMLKTHRALFIAQEEVVEKPTTSIKAAVFSLVLATVFIALMSEMLVDEIGVVTQKLGMTELFVGVIVVAIIGNAAEHSTAILVAMRNKMDLAMTIAVGSSTQIALFVAPLLVFLSWLIGKPMSLVFNGFELAAIALSVLIVEMISSDGETNWFEGAQLLALYMILGIAFYFVPA
jgi:Ca2+:H+ antiporter